jgi:hypothetical protein
VSNSDDLTARLWDVATGKELLRIPTNGDTKTTPILNTLFFSKGGLVVASLGTNDAMVRVYGTTTGQERFRIPCLAGPWGLGASAGGRFLAAACSDKTVRVWDLLAGTEKCFDKAQGNALVSPPSFSADASLLVSLINDQTVALWRVAPPQKAGPLKADVAQTAFVDALRFDVPVKDGFATHEAAPPAGDDKQTVAMLKVRLRDLRARFRLVSERVGQLLKDLESDKYPIRDKATKELHGLGRTAEPFLREALTRPVTIELRQRLTKVLSTVTLPSVEMILAISAIELLEGIGTEEARQLLAEAGDGLPPFLAAEAKLSLARCAKKSTSP